MINYPPITKMTLQVTLCLTCMIFTWMTSLAGLGLVIRYSYYEDLWHYHQDTCVTACRERQYTCCTHHKSGNTCSTCTGYYIDFSLWLNDTLYAKSIPFDVCTPPNATCYYDDRAIQASLDLVAPTPISIIGVILLSVFIFVSTIVYIWIAIAGWQHFRSKLQEQESPIPLPLRVTNPDIDRINQSISDRINQSTSDRINPSTLSGS